MTYFILGVIFGYVMAIKLLPVRHFAKKIIN